MIIGVDRVVSSKSKRYQPVPKTEVDIFIEKIKQAAKQKSSKMLQELIATGPNIDVLDNNELSAAMHLARENDLGACALLENHGANPEDFVCGAAVAGNMEAYFYFRTKLVEKGLTLNYNRLAAYMALGGHYSSAILMLNNPELESANFTRAACYAALGGHYDVAILLIEDSKSIANDPVQVAAYFALGGHRTPTIHHLKRIREMGRLDEISGFAAKGGDLDLALVLLRHPSSAKYNLLASYSAQGGHYEQTLTLLDHPNNKNPEYLDAAAYAALKGHKQLALTLLWHAKNTHHDINKVIDFAARGNHLNIVMSLLTHPENKHPDYNQAAATAAGEGHAALAMKLLTDPRNTKPDFGFVITFAELASQQAIAKSIRALHATVSEVVSESSCSSSMVNTPLTFGWSTSASNGSDPRSGALPESSHKMTSKRPRN